MLAMVQSCAVVGAWDIKDPVAPPPPLLLSCFCAVSFGAQTREE